MENIEQEKPKQIKCYCGHTTYCDCGPLEVSDEAKQRAKNYMSLKGALESKQETLEEAAQKYLNEKYQKGGYLGNLFIAGAKSDAAKDYWFKIFKEQFKKK